MMDRIKQQFSVFLKKNDINFSLISCLFFSSCYIYVLAGIAVIFLRKYRNLSIFRLSSYILLHKIKPRREYILMTGIPGLVISIDSLVFNLNARLRSTRLAKDAKSQRKKRAQKFNGTTKEKYFFDALLIYKRSHLLFYC